MTGAIRDAARATGASFEYLLKTAQRESNFNPTARARTSSASGLFQFIDQTWLQTLKASGAEHGYGRQAGNIVQTSSGRFVVPGAADRREIMQLRNDPTAASAMAGAFTQRNAEMLAEQIGRQPTDGELYIAHFLGPTGAIDLINAATNNPDTRAANLFPRAARANRSIFYAGGKPRTAQQVYGVLVAKHQNTRMPPGAAPTMLAGRAEAPQTVQPLAAARSMSAAPAAAPGPVTATRAPSTARAYAAQPGPVFHGLFHTERTAPVSAVVSELWGVKAAQPAAAAAASGAGAQTGGSTAAQAPAGNPLPLFHFLRPEIRSLSSRST